MRKNWQEIFEDVRDNMPAGQPVTWEDLCSQYFGMSIPEYNGSPEWTQYVVDRKRCTQQINNLCEKYRENWRIFSFMYGVSVIRRECGDMVNNETQDRLRYVAGSLKRIKTKLRPMSTAEGISARDKKLIQSMVDMATGATMTIGGMISNMTSLNNVQKQELLEQFGIVKQPELE